MNERIKELATQSGIAMIPNSHPISITGLTTDLEKFAESIVAETCAVLAENREFRAAVLVGKHFMVES